MSLLNILESFIMKVEPEWKAMHNVADKRLPKVRTILEQAFTALQRSIDIDELAKHPIPMMADRISWHIFEEECQGLYDELGLVLIDGGNVAAKYLSNKFMTKYNGSVKKLNMPIIGGSSPEGLQLTGSFDMRNPAAVLWAQQHTGELIKQINDTSKQGIRQILTDAQAYGGHPYETARQIRQFIGLTDRQMKGVLNRQRELDEEGRPQAQVDRMIDAEIRRRIRARANTIARTETIAVSAAGQQLHWEDQLNKGYLDKDNMVKAWIVTPDDRLCPICAAMQDEKTGIDQPFLFGGKAPPRHPNCRCAIGLEEKEGAELATYMESEQGKDWTKVDQLLGLPPIGTILAAGKKVKEVITPDAKKKEQADKLKAEKEEYAKLKTPEERAQWHIDKLYNMTDKEFSKNLNGYLSKNGYGKIYNINALEMHQQRAVAYHTIELQEKYPLGNKTYFNFKDFGEADKNVYAHYLHGAHCIEMNTRYFNKNWAALEKSYANDVASGYHPKGTKAMSIITHEYGHAVQFDMRKQHEVGIYDAKKKKNIIPANVDQIRRSEQSIEYVFQTYGSEIQSSVSKYGTKNSFEMFAEGFTQMHYIGEMTNKFTKFVAKVIRKEV